MGWLGGTILLIIINSLHQNITNNLRNQLSIDCTITDPLQNSTKTNITLGNTYSKKKSTNK
jgi:hypothetical protein